MHNDPLEFELVVILVLVVFGQLFELLLLFLIVLQVLHVFHTQRFSQLYALLCVGLEVQLRRKLQSGVYLGVHEHVVVEHNAL